MAKNNEVEIGFPRDVQRETQEICLTKIRKKLNGSVAVRASSVNGGAIMVNLNGIERARSACDDILGKNCRNVDIQYAA